MPTLKAGLREGSGHVLSNSGLRAPGLTSMSIPIFLAPLGIHTSLHLHTSLHHLHHQVQVKICCKKYITLRKKCIDALQTKHKNM